MLILARTAIFANLPAYEKQQLLDKPFLKKAFIQLTTEALTKEESKDVTSLYLAYYKTDGGLYRRICDAGAKAGARPMLMMCSEDGQDCLYANVMTYLVASQIATLGARPDMTPDTYKRMVRGYLANYRSFQREHMNGEPLCRGLFLAGSSNCRNAIWR